jgi:uncharacterized protein (TIGR01777 family)
MKILVAGSSGLIGSALVKRLKQEHHEVSRLVRRPPTSADEIQWYPPSHTIDEARIAGIEAVIHLGGASIAGKRWNDAYKREIRDSRVSSTHLLSEALARMPQKPRVFLCASALGYYGERGDELLPESSRKGDGFLADITAEWEAATAPASEAGIRVCNMRIGVALSKTGELPRSMLLPFKLGLGGKLGNGRQYMSWIHIDDVVGAFAHALNTPSMHGPINLSAPNPVTNAEFTRTLARVLSRPAFFTVPAFALRIAMGEMAEFALASVRMYPLRITESGFKFKWDNIEAALRDILSD